MRRLLWLLVVLSLVQPAWADITGATLWWAFNDGSGTTIADSSGNGRTGTLAGTQHWQTAAACKVQTCLGFVGTDSNVVTSTTTIGTLMSATTGTVAAWVNPHGASFSGGTSYATHGIFGEVSQFMGIFRGTTGSPATDAIWLYNYDGNEDKIGIPYTVDTFVHIVWVHGGGTLTGYKNGQLVTPVGGGASCANPCTSGNTGGVAGTLVVGKSTTGNNYITAEIDEIRTYNRALSAADIDELYQYGLATLGNRWRMMKREQWRDTVKRWMFAGRLR